MCSFVVSELFVSFPALKKLGNFPFHLFKLNMFNTSIFFTLYFLTVGNS